MSDAETPSLGRRQFLRRGAMVGGAVIWATPVVQSISPAAYANGSPRPCADISWVGVLIRTGTVGNYQYRVYKLSGDAGYSPSIITDARGDSTRAFDRMMLRAGNPALQTTTLSPAPFTSSVGAGGDLVLTISMSAANATLVGWMVHDGQVEGSGKNNHDGTLANAGQSPSENAFALGDDWGLVPAGWNLPGDGVGDPATGSGTFTWSKPGAARDC
jgi:hypothetical protein